MFRSDGNAILEASVDASNKQDQRDGQVVFGYQARLGGGPIIAEVAKLKNSGFGTPAVEFMALATCFSQMELPSVSMEQESDAALLSGRWAAASIVWLRQMLEEIGFGTCCAGPTRVQSDNKGAIEWMRFRKVTPGNNYILLSYHQQREWLEQGFVTAVFQRGIFNLADLFTKAVSRQVIQRLLMKFLGYELMIPGEGVDGAEDDLAVTDQWLCALPSINARFSAWKLK